jgi:hypothetical protein
MVFPFLNLASNRGINSVSIAGKSSFFSRRYVVATKTKMVKVINKKFRRLVHQIFPGGWWALLFPAALILWLVVGNGLAALWCFTAACAFQAIGETNRNEQQE